MAAALAVETFNTITREVQPKSLKENVTENN